MRGAESIEIQDRSDEVNRFGDPVGLSAIRLVRGCVIIPRRSGSEPNDPTSTTVISGLQVFAPPGTVVKATSRVRARGYWYEVDGEVGDYRDTRGTARAVEILLKRVTG